MGRHSSEGPRVRQRRGQLRVGVLGASLLVGVLGSGAFIWNSTSAAFTASTTNGSNSWSVGSVAISDDDAGNAMFTVTNLKPGDTNTKCINVAYTGTLNGNVRLYVSALTDGTPKVGDYLKLTIEEGSGATGGATGSCTSFSSSSTLYNNGTLTNLNTTKGSWANGYNWAVAGSATKSYRFSYTLDAATPDDRQGKSVSATFTWEAQNS
jgi:hypothetical protein